MRPLQLRPNQFEDELGNDAALNGNHTYTHFNPMVGATYKLTPNLTFYGDFAEANRQLLLSLPAPIHCGLA